MMIDNSRDFCQFLKCLTICPIRIEIKSKELKFIQRQTIPIKYKLKEPLSKSTKNKNYFVTSIKKNEIEEINSPCFQSNIAKKSTNQLVDTNRHRSERNEIKSFLTRLKRAKICTKNTQYNVIRRVANTFLMAQVSEKEAWNILWTDLSVSVSRCKQMKSFQMINHFPGMYHVCRKDCLVFNYNRLASLFPEHYDFIPRTFILPGQYQQLMKEASHTSKQTFICKPKTSSKGMGIFLIQNLPLLKPFSSLVCQEYLKNPLLIDGYKFDLRLYVLLTCCSPLRVYVYKEGLARFSTSKYKKPKEGNISNLFIHLTNYSINRYSKKFTMDYHKKTLSSVFDILQKKGINIEILWKQIDAVIIKTLYSVECYLDYYFKLSFQNHLENYPCFEILGFDILLDTNHKVHLLEVNHSPSLNRQTEIDKIIKRDLIQDTFRLVNLSKYRQRKKNYENFFVPRRFFQNKPQVDNENKMIDNDDENVSFKMKQEQFQKMLQRKFKWESTHLGNFREICFEKDEELFKLHGLITKHFNSKIEKELVTEEDNEETM